MSGSIDNPYVGPRTFNREEADRFFGREAEAGQLLSRVISERLVLFYAQSGAGKSSLVNTRLLPELQKSGFTVLPVGRVSGELPAGVGPVKNIYTFNLMLSLDQSSRDPNRFADINLSQFLDRLTISGDGASWYYDESIEGSLDGEVYEENPYILIIDQFEEIVTTYVEHWEKRQAFFVELNQAMEAEPLLGVVLVLREDYVAALEPYASFLADGMRARFYMQRLSYGAALEAVKEPASLAGRPFAPKVAESLVDNLRQIRVHGEVLPQPGQFVEPVQLQVVCYQLWQNLKQKKQALESQVTFEDLKTLGDVDFALAHYYNQALDKVLRRLRGQKTWQEKVKDMLFGKDDEAELRRWFSQKLITEAGTRGTVYRGDKETAGVLTYIADAFANQYLLRSEIRAGGKWYELTHDRFIQPISKDNRDWLLAYVPKIKIIYLLVLPYIIPLIYAVLGLIFAQSYDTILVIGLMLGVISFIAIGVAMAIGQGARYFFTAGRLTLAGRSGEAGKLLSRVVFRDCLVLIVVLIAGCLLLFISTALFSIFAPVR